MVLGGFRWFHVLVTTESKVIARVTSVSHDVRLLFFFL